MRTKDQLAVGTGTHHGFLEGVREHCTIMRGMRIRHPDADTVKARFTGKPRKRVLMFDTKIDGTWRNAGTIINTVQVRTFFQRRQDNQDVRLHLADLDSWSPEE